MSDLISRQDAIDALKICDANYDGGNCHKCPLRDERWDGAWEDDETNCYTKLMRDSAKLLELPSAEPEIIRCKDCKWRSFYHDVKYGVGYSLCGNPKNMLNDSMIAVNADDFCSFAERREEK